MIRRTFMGDVHLCHLAMYKKIYTIDNLLFKF